MLLASILVHSDSYTMNTKHFVEMAQRIHLEEDAVMTSHLPVYQWPRGRSCACDQGVVAGGPDTPRSYHTASKQGGQSPGVPEVHLLHFGGVFFEQKEGTAMGLPVSAIVANLYMELFEELALATALERPKVWKWCLDDTFCVWRKALWRDSWMIWIKYAQQSSSLLNLSSSLTFPGHLFLLSITPRWSGYHTVPENPPTCTDWYLDSIHTISFRCSRGLWGACMTEPMMTRLPRATCKWTVPTVKNLQTDWVLFLLHPVSRQSPSSAWPWMGRMTASPYWASLMWLALVKRSDASAGVSTSDWFSSLVAHSTPCSPGWRAHYLRTRIPGGVQDPCSCSKVCIEETVRRLETGS